jgi:hypothetical protein
MIPLSFDPQTAREMTGDEAARVIEAKARSDADAGTFDPPKWVCLRSQMQIVVYTDQFYRRDNRNRRKSGKPEIDHGKWWPQKTQRQKDAEAALEEMARVERERIARLCVPLHLPVDLCVVTQRMK